MQIFPRELPHTGACTHASIYQTVAGARIKQLINNSLPAPSDKRNHAPDSIARSPHRAHLVYFLALQLYIAIAASLGDYSPATFPRAGRLELVCTYTVFFFLFLWAPASDHYYYHCARAASQESCCCCVIAGDYYKAGT